MLICRSKSLSECSTVANNVGLDEKTFSSELFRLIMYLLERKPFVVQPTYGRMQIIQAN